MHDQISKTSFQKSPRQPQSWVQGKIRRPLAVYFALLVIATGGAIADVYLPNLLLFPNLTGFSATNSTTGRLT